jgi:radical SAM superfamily enzyme YgiQ (UPF0313 family)
MKLHFIFPKWPKLKGQTPFCLPPLGMIQAAACVPEHVAVTALDENVSPVDLDVDADLVGISIMLTCQSGRAYELADAFRARGKPVVLGGLHVALCPEDAQAHADAIVVGEGEGLIERMVADFERGALQPRYTRDAFADIAAVPLPRRDLYDKGTHYTYKGWELVDLVETSRGCRFDCYPCCTPFLGGRQHRIKPIEKTLADMRRCAETLFIVDNSLEQNVEYEKDLFRAMKGLGKHWISHPITPDPEVLTLAQASGCWYMYHAIYTISEKIKDRIKLYHDHGILVEGTILLGLDDHTEDFIKRFVDFLQTIDLDLAEFTVLTPFPRTRVWDDLEAEGRILDRNLSHYDAGTVVYRPKLMTPDTLQRLYHHAWDAFYDKQSQQLRMSKLFLQLLRARQGGRRRAKTKPPIPSSAPGERTE